MQTTKITCDGCGGDLTDAGAMPTYCLVLKPASVPNSGNVIYDVAVQPDIDRSYHFCDINCLDHWRGRELHREGLWRDWWASWKAEHGTQHWGGMVICPSAPEDIRKARAAEFKDSALVAFPMSRPARRA